MFGEVVTGEGSNGFPIISLKSFDGLHKCQIYLHGATLTSWVSDGKEQLYLSPDAVFDSSKPIRGGIPIVFPQFSQPNKTLPQHGFARTSTWEFFDSVVDASCVSATFRLSDSEYTRSIWNHKFSLLYRVLLDKSSLKTELVITNQGDEEFSCNCLLHTYLLVPSIHEVNIFGLWGLQYIDKVQNSAVFIDLNESNVIRNEVDRIYFPSAEKQINHVTVRKNEATLNVDFGASIHKSYPLGIDEATDEQSTDVVIWNAWQDRCKAIGDIPDDAYLNYVCVEPGVVSKFVQLLPEHSLKLHQSLTIKC